MKPARRKVVLRAVAALAAVVGAVTFALLRLLPSGSDTPGSFDTQRALRDLQVIAREPHVSGSPQDLQVVNFVADRLRSLGLEVRVEQGTWRTRGRSPRTLDLHNVVARLRGTGGLGGAVMLSAHHDSVRAAPGAADDGAAVAALLEVARLLAAHPPRRDVLFAITDGEEEGLLGARLFTLSDPARTDIAAVLNFDARGSSGPAAMFETSDPNAGLVDQYARFAPHPVTTSLAGVVYRHMPNGTDFTAFKAAGLAGLNFAFLGSFQNYHHPSDDIAHLSLRSLAHEGKTALALTQRFGNALIPHASENAVYFDLWSFFVVHYRLGWVIPLAWLTAAIAMSAAAVTVRRRAAPVMRTVAEALAGIGLAVAGIGISAGVTLATVRALGDRWAASGFDWLCAGAAVYAAAVAAALPWLVQRWIAVESIACGMIVLWAGLGLVAAHALPEGSYLFVFPVWLVAIAMLIATMGHRREWIAFSLIIALAVATAMNAGHLYLASLAVEADGLHWVVAGEALILWLVTPVMWLAVRGDGGQYPKFKRNGGICDSNDA